LLLENEFSKCNERKNKGEESELLKDHMKMNRIYVQVLNSQVYPSFL